MVPARVVAGTDGSPRSLVAAHQGAHLAAAFGGTLDLLYVLDTRQPRDDADREREGERALSAVVEAARSVGVVPEARVLVGDPAAVLTEIAGEGEASILVLGPDAGLLERRTRLGGVAARVLRAAPCSVMIARGEAASPFPVRILVGVDGSDAALLAVEWASRLAAATRAALNLVHVVPVFHGESALWDVEEDAEGFQPLEPAAEVAAVAGAFAEREMAMGRPGPAIVEAARRRDADLVVIGSRGLRGLSRVLLGSVSGWVAQHADRSVMVVRPRAEDREEADPA